jgi:hypothetical protein
VVKENKSGVTAQGKGVSKANPPHSHKNVLSRHSPFDAYSVRGYGSKMKNQVFSLYSPCTLLLYFPPKNYLQGYNHETYT